MIFNLDHKELYEKEILYIDVRAMLEAYIAQEGEDGLMYIHVALGAILGNKPITKKVLDQSVKIAEHYPVKRDDLKTQLDKELEEVEGEL